MKEFWNQRYAEAGYVYGREPNAYIRRFIDDHEAGSILFPAEGEGRNAVYAAAKGWRVTAFDYSESAREKALALAVGAGLEIDYHLADAEEFPFPTGAYDAVGLCF
jgi:SAM-dependent methyltransferase